MARPENTLRTMMFGNVSNLFGIEPAGMGTPNKALNGRLMAATGPLGLRGFLCLALRAIFAQTPLRPRPA